MSIKSELDNPLVFVALITVIVFSMSKVFKWGATNVKHTGTASIFN